MGLACSYDSQFNLTRVQLYQLIPKIIDLAQPDFKKKIVPDCLKLPMPILENQTTPEKQLALDFETKVVSILEVFMENKGKICDIHELIVNPKPVLAQSSYLVSIYLMSTYPGGLLLVSLRRQDKNYFLSQLQAITNLRKCTIPPSLRFWKLPADPKESKEGESVNFRVEVFSSNNTQRGYLLPFMMK